MLYLALKAFRCVETSHRLWDLSLCNYRKRKGLYKDFLIAYTTSLLSSFPTRCCKSPLFSTSNAHFSIFEKLTTPRGISITLVPLCIA